jgi:hypothetical protein
MRPSQGLSRTAKLGYFGLPALALAPLTANVWLTLLAIVALLSIVLLVWRRGEPPVLVFICFMQWLQASIKVLQADLLGLPIGTFLDSHSLEEASELTLIWVVVIAIGIRLTLMVEPARKVSNALDSLTPRVLLLLYVAWTLLVQTGGALGGGVSQLFVALSNMRWAVVFALFWSAIAQKRNYGLVAAVFLIELVTGLFSFFSSFKIPIYLLALALPAGNYRIRAQHIAGSLVVAAFALYMGVIWSAIKGEYRETISGGTMEQVVTVSRGEQARELVRLAGTVDEPTLERGITTLVARISYVEYFALTLDFVPAVREHERGLLWGNAIRHVLTPRLFFPDKEDLESDTAIARRYTGAELTWNSATSISLGTPAETYVDFGAPLMFLPALCIGLVFGMIYRGFSAYGTRASLAQGFAVALLLPMSTVELTPSKALGGVLTHLFVAILLWQFLLPMIARMSRPTSLSAAPQPR